MHYFRQLKAITPSLVSAGRCVYPNAFFCGAQMGWMNGHHHVACSTDIKTIQEALGHASLDTRLGLTGKAGTVESRAGACLVMGSCAVRPQSQVPTALLNVFKIACYGNLCGRWLTLRWYKEYLTGGVLLGGRYASSAILRSPSTISSDKLSNPGGSCESLLCLAIRKQL